MTTIDLNKAAKERAALRNGEKHHLKFKDLKVMLPDEPPARVLLLMGRDDGAAIEEFFQLMLGDKADAFWQLNPSIQDTQEFMKNIESVYGFSEGESQPPEDS